MRKVEPKPKTIPMQTVFDFANDASIRHMTKPQDGDLYWSVVPGQEIFKGRNNDRRFIRIEFRKIKEGNPPIAYRAISYPGYIPEDSIKLDIVDPEVTFVNPVLDYK